MRSLALALPLVVPLVLATALAGCSNAGLRNCHRAAQADGVDANGDLHYPEVCTASTTPAATPAPVANDPISQALAHLRVETPDPCREYARARCEQGDRCDDVVREVNRIATRRRPYPQCIALLRRAQHAEPRVAGK